MRRFVKDVFAWSVPILIIVAIFFGFYAVGYFSGEFQNIDKLIEAQRKNHSIILGMGYNEQKEYYKVENANYYKAEVIALGTSRAMQFKELYFETDFYNCGGAVSGNYNEYVNFLKNLDYIPSVIILDLDAWVFNEAWNYNRSDYEEYVEITLADRNKLAMTKSIIIDFFNGKWELSDLQAYPDNVGFNGKIQDSGFMYDGSYYNGFTPRYPAEAADYEFADTLRRIEEGSSRFEYGKHIDEDTLIQLENFLGHCKENGIYVIGYLAPFAPSIYQTMEENGHYGYLKEISPACTEMFRKYGYSYYDYADGSVLGVTDDFFLDGFHGSEVVYAVMIRDMISDDEILNQCINKSKLESLINSAYSGMVFENPDNRK